MLKSEFLQMVKPLLDPKTYNKLKFGYSDDHKTNKMIEEFFDMDHLESAFGGKYHTLFDVNEYAERMKEEDKKILFFWTRANTLSSVPPHNAPLESIKLDADYDASNKEKIDCSPVTKY